MMNVELMRTVIKRQDRPDNSSLNKRIKDIYAESIGFISIPETLNPQVGWIIRYKDNDYTIRNIIYNVSTRELTYEVSPYNTSVFREFGSGTGMQFSENIPLCIDLPIKEENDES